MKDPRYIGVKQLVIEWDDTVLSKNTASTNKRDLSGYVHCKGCTGLDNQEGQIIVFAKLWF